MDRFPGNLVGVGTERLVGSAASTKYGEGHAIEHGESFGQARPASVMAILVPPAIFCEEQGVLHVPVVAD